MIRDFASFYKEITGKDALAVWQNAKIHKIEVHSRSKAWFIYVQISETLPARTVRQTAKEILEHMSYLKHLEIIPLLSEPSRRINEIINSRQEELSSFFFDNGKFTDHIEWDCTGKRLDLVTTDEEVYNYMIEKQVCNHLANWFQEEYSLRVLVRVLGTGSEPEIPSNTINAGRKADVLEIKDYTQVSRQTGKRPGRKRELLEQQEVIKLSELQEGLKTVVVEGEVWKKEITNIRGNRYLLTYYLTDYTDSLMLKIFLDTLNEDKIKEGQWIKASGNLRYDDIARELVLFLETYIPVQKKVRSDSARQKRIELHAHTKMSAMDGLCNISALIKRAAEWQHPAITITDHGCIQAFPEAHQASLEHKIKVIYGVEGYLVEDNKKDTPYHIVLLARNQTGLRNLYYLVSKSYIDYFYRQPRIPRRELEEHREGILLGSACEAGELYQALLDDVAEQDLEKVAAFYDYLEIQPLANNDFLIRKGRVKDQKHLQQLNRRVVELGKRLNKPVVATGDVHFLEPQDEVFRRIIQSGQGYEDAEVQAPLYFRTTAEMLEEFSYLGREEAQAVVIDNPGLINEMVEVLQPVPDGFYPPKIDSAEEDIIKLTWEGANKLYGNNIPTRNKS